jgi:hypothetical protein
VSAVLAKGSVFADESGHWYSRKGEPRYRIIGANGKERNTTLADARKLDLLPSVSTIMQIEAKPQLTRWLVEQGMLACLTLPRVPGESDQEFMARALLDSKQQVVKAAERGTYLHGRMEESVRASQFIGQPEDSGYIQPVLDWLNKEFYDYQWSAERSFASDLGFGGKMDLTGTHPELHPVTIDYKMKDFSDKNKTRAYDEHVTQLAAYSNGLGYHRPRCLNIFISSTVPGLFVVKEWTDDEISRGWRAFKALLELWNTRKKFA